MLKAIFFDFGDTLVNDEVFGLNGDIKAVEKIIAIYNLDNQSSKYISLVKEAQCYMDDKIRKEKWSRHRNESIQEFGVRYKKERYAKLIELMGGEPDEKNVELVFKAYLEGIVKVDSLFPEVKEVLKVLDQRYKLGLLSNNIAENIPGPLQCLPLDRFFDVVVISGEENVSKPNPEIFNRALKRIGVGASEAMMVGDSVVADIEGAKSVGMSAVWVNKSGEEADSDVKPDYVIKNLIELLDIV